MHTLKLLLATNHLWANTGSELTLLGLTRALAERGHEVACFGMMLSPPMAQSITLEGIRLLRSRDDLTSYAPQAVYCQHHTTAAAIRSRLATTPILLAHLGVEPEFEQSPLVDCNIYRHLALSEEVRGMLLRQGVSRWKISIFRNAVDFSQFSQSSCSRSGDKAILFSYKLSDAQRAAVREAVAREGLQLDEQSMTSSGQIPYEAIIRGVSSARLVFASGRSAIEAAMSGAPTVVIGPRGLDGAVTSQSIESLAKANLSGRRHAKPITVESVHASVREALATDLPSARSHAVRLFDTESRAKELERLCVDATKRRTKPLKARLFERVQRLDKLLSDQSQMTLWQREKDQLAATLPIAKASPPPSLANPISISNLSEEDRALDAKSLMERGMESWRQQRPDQALGYFLAALGHEPRSIEVARHFAHFLLIYLSSSYTKSSDFEVRKRALRAFLCLQPHNQWALQTLVRFAVDPYDDVLFRELALHSESWSSETKHAVKSTLESLRVAGTSEGGTLLLKRLST